MSRNDPVFKLKIDEIFEPDTLMVEITSHMVRELKPWKNPDGSGVKQENRAGDYEMIHHGLYDVYIINVRLNDERVHPVSWEVPHRKALEDASLVETYLAIKEYQFKRRSETNTEWRK